MHDDGFEKREGLAYRLQPSFRIELARTLVPTRALHSVCMHECNGERNSLFMDGYNLKY